MIFKVTHIDTAGHCRKARVSATSAGEAMDQMDALYGDARTGACLRMATSPVLFVVGRGHRVVQRNFQKGAVCGL